MNPAALKHGISDHRVQELQQAVSLSLTTNTTKLCTCENEHKWAQFTEMNPVAPPPLRWTLDVFISTGFMLN